jgi:Kelch motif
MSITRDHVAAVALNGKIYALGGRPGAGAVYATVEIYDPAANKWSPGVDMQEGRSGFGCPDISSSWAARSS